MLCLCLPAASLAQAQSHLSSSEARQTILTYEHAYWRPFSSGSVPITLSQCKRYSPTRVSCLARITIPGFLAYSRDWVALSPQGVASDNPGGLEMCVTQAQPGFPLGSCS